MHTRLAIAAISMLAPFSLVDAADISVKPKGLEAGDTYRLIFITEGDTEATSSEIAEYNRFATEQAESVPELKSLNTTWMAVVSTADVHARNNIEGALKVEPENFVGIFLLNGSNTKVAESYEDLWDGELNTPINVTQNGQIRSKLALFSGSNKGGFKAKDFELGSPMVRTGSGKSTKGSWMSGYQRRSSDELPVYVISDVLTVGENDGDYVDIPEPSVSVLLAGLGSLAVAFLRRRR